MKFSGNYRADGLPVVHPCRQEAFAHFAHAMISLNHTVTAEVIFRWHPDLVWC